MDGNASTGIRIRDSPSVLWLHISQLFELGEHAAGEHSMGTSRDLALRRRKSSDIHLSRNGGAIHFRAAGMPKNDKQFVLRYTYDAKVTKQEDFPG